jgi:hypothetical protein
MIFAEERGDEGFGLEEQSSSGPQWRAKKKSSKKEIE